jgi:hypothetical protein
MAMLLVGMVLKMGQVMVMNQETWEMVRDTLAEGATKATNPLGYLARYNGIDMIVDDDLPYDYIEVYPSIEFYEMVLKYRKGSDASAGDVG